jgi:hypothetical protein
MKRKWVLRSESTYSNGIYGELTLRKPHQNGGGNTGVSISSIDGGGGGGGSGGGSSSSSTRIHECEVLLFMRADGMTSALTPRLKSKTAPIYP